MDTGNPNLSIIIGIITKTPDLVPERLYISLNNRLRRQKNTPHNHCQIHIVNMDIYIKIRDKYGLYLINLFGNNLKLQNYQ